MITSDRLRIVLTASEAVPFSKTGGLADVTTALAKALDASGHDVTIIVPDYRVLRKDRQHRLPSIADSGLRLAIAMNGRQMTAGVNWTTLPGNGVTVLLVRQAHYFDRSQLYMEHGKGYVDNCERYCFFSRAVMEICRQMVLRPDIVHCNDWQTGLVPALLHSQYAHLPGFENAASVMTLHNMAYQGRFWHLDMPLTGMDWRYFNMHHMEFWGDLNLLKTGINFADQITTVSPTYAEEICTPEFGEHLDSVLKVRRDDLVGILNGIDTDEWNPATDHQLPATYTFDSADDGKSVCKRHLQERMGLPARSDVPLFGMVSRMSDQKGFDLIAGAAGRILHQDVQIAFLGTGDPRYEGHLQYLAAHNPDKVAVFVGFDEGLAHQVEAGADAFLMPSRFEPCGLNQMYSLRYGTVPVVRAVGGLADSVVDLTPQTLEAGTATGFAFSDYTEGAFATTFERAVRTYHDRAVWKELMKSGMAADWSWDRSANRYLDTYRKALERRHDRVHDRRC
ncbi:MAG: glycogen synthase GlgA [Planctomycetaceae bacterium]